MPQVQSIRKPNKGFSLITQAGLKAHDLYQTHQARLGKRIEQALIDGLAGDLELLGVHVPGAIAARGSSKAATTGQNTALAMGYARVTALRTNVDSTTSTTT